MITFNGKVKDISFPVDGISSIDVTFFINACPDETVRALVALLASTKSVKVVVDFPDLPKLMEDYPDGEPMMWATADVPFGRLACDYNGYSCSCAGYKKAAAGSTLCECGHPKSQHHKKEKEKP